MNPGMCQTSEDSTLKFYLKHEQQKDTDEGALHEFKIERI